jgi:glucoamylase
MLISGTTMDVSSGSGRPPPTGPGTGRDGRDAIVLRAGDPVEDRHGRPSVREYAPTVSRVGPVRRVLTGALVAVATVSTCAAGSHPYTPSYAEIPLYADGVAVDRHGIPEVVPVGSTIDHHPVHQARQDAWLARGSVPGPDRYAALAEQALRDLEALVLPGGAAVAAASSAWRYVWPRDASFTVAALARTGHTGDAHQVLLYLQRMQDLRSTDGVMEARYLPDGTGAVPDARGLQLDGNGWVLWAVAEWWTATPPGAVRDDGLEALRPLVMRSLDAVRAHVDPGTGLPGVFPDYWEVRERVPTLGTLAPLLAGVRAVEPVLAALGLPSEAPLADLLERGVEDHFAPRYPRRLAGLQRDTAVAFLMPPFAPARPDVTVAWREAMSEMGRPAGGLAPGAGWKQDGVSWTPTTAMFALTAAASGDVDGAAARLDWLAAHRTARGALPEKVLWDGSPSAVAPLAWTASLVLLTLDELDRQAADGTR